MFIAACLDVIILKDTILFVFREGKILPVETPGSGCCRYLTVDWINKVMVKAYKSNLSSNDLYELSDRDEACFNAERFQRLWEEEVNEAKANKNGARQPSLSKCVWKFARTRMILSAILITLSVVLQFIAPVNSTIICQYYLYLFY